MGKGKTVMIARTAAGSAEGPSSRRLYRRTRTRRSKYNDNTNRKRWWRTCRCVQSRIKSNIRLIIGGNDIKYAIDRSKVQWRDTNRVTIQTLLSSRSLSPRIASRPCKIIIEGSQQGPEWATITPQGVSLETQPV